MNSFDIDSSILLKFSYLFIGLMLYTIAYQHWVGPNTKRSASSLLLVDLIHVRKDYLTITKIHDKEVKTHFSFKRIHYIIKPIWYLYVLLIYNSVGILVILTYLWHCYVYLTSRGWSVLRAESCIKNYFIWIYIYTYKIIFNTTFRPYIYMYISLWSIKN